MNKKILSIIMMIMLGAVSFAQDNSADIAAVKPAEPDAVTEATKGVNVKVGVSVDVKDQNKLYTAGENADTHKQFFDKYRNRMNAKGGALINFNDVVVLNPYARINNFDFVTKNITYKSGDNTSDYKTEGTFGLKSGSLHFGVGLSADPTDWLSIDMTLFQWDYFTPTTPIWAGLGGSLGLSFSAEKAFFTFDLWDEISVRFADVENVSKMHLLNLFDYGFEFYFLNFINPKINTGLYGEGEFELNFETNDGQFAKNELYNEFYIGIKSKPLPFLSLWTSFFVQAGAEYNEDCSQTLSTGYIELGLLTGIGFNYNGFNVSFSYEPHLYKLGDESYGDWHQTPIEQQFAITIGYKFKTYFTKK